MRRPSVFIVKLLGRRQVGVVVLPGGTKLRLSGPRTRYFNDKICVTCRTEKNPAFFPCGWERSKLYLWLVFGDECIRCQQKNNPDLEFAFPADLPPAIRIKGLTNNDGSEQVWFARNRRGQIGDPIHQSKLQFLKDGNGIVRPQPNLDRRSEEEKRINPKLQKRKRAARATDETSYVYFKQEKFGSERVKIGRGQAKRACSGRSTDNSRELIVMLRLIETEERSEAFFHEKFSRHRIYERQEWFWLHDDIRDFVQSEIDAGNHVEA